MAISGQADQPIPSPRLRGPDLPRQRIWAPWLPTALANRLVVLAAIFCAVLPNLSVLLGQLSPIAAANVMPARSAPGSFGLHIFCG